MSVTDLLTIDSSYNLAAGAAVVGTVCGVLENFKGPTAKLFGGAAVVFTAFGAFVAFQTANLRFQFDPTSFSLVKSDGASIGENVVVGGENSWKYNTFVNYDFLPSEDFPILVYFKETQTPKESWVEAPIVVDNAEGQAHFFPAIANTAQLKEQFQAHGCKKL
jgi:NIMA (never in mitosis gene a)-related kinase